MKKNNTGLFSEPVALVSQLLDSDYMGARDAITDDGSQQIIPDDSSTESIVS